MNYIPRDQVEKFISESLGNKVVRVNNWDDRIWERSTLRKRDLTRRYHKWTPEDEARMKRMLADFTVQRTADAMGLSMKQVKARMQAMGIKRRDLKP